MSDFLFVGFIVVLFLSFLGVSRVLSTVLHELGHYVAGTFLLGGNYDVYIGSYGDPNESLKIKIGNLKIYFTYRAILWNCGLCVASGMKKSFLGNFIYILAGPFTSFLTIVFCFYFLIIPELNGIIKLGCVLLIFSSVVDIFRNLIPDEKPVILYDGNTTFNDGQSLKILLRYRKSYSVILRIHDLYKNNRIKEAINLCQNSYAHHKSPELIRIAISLFMEEENYVDALNKKKELEAIADLNSDDYGLVALIYARIEDYEKAFQYYFQSIQVNPNNFISLNNRGYTLNLVRKYQDAIIDFDKALELNPNFAYAYNNRGLAKIKLGNLNEGLSDINKSLELDSNNSYAYKNLGIYYFDIENYEKARELFLKAKELDPKTHEIDELLNEVNCIL